MSTSNWQHGSQADGTAIVGFAVHASTQGIENVGDLRRALSHLPDDFPVSDGWSEWSHGVIGTWDGETAQTLIINPPI